MKRIAYLMTGVFLGVIITSLAFTNSSGMASSQDLDPVKLSPQFYKVLLDNDQVRVLEYRLKPGEKEPMHSHTPGVLYIFGDAKMRATLTNGKTEESSGGSGEAHWRKPVTHAMENIGNTEAHALAIDLKNPCKQ